MVACIEADNRAVNTWTNKATHFCCSWWRIAQLLNYSCISRTLVYKSPQQFSCRIWCKICRLIHK